MAGPGRAERGPKPAEVVAVKEALDEAADIIMALMGLLSVVEDRLFLDDEWSDFCAAIRHVIKSAKEFLRKYSLSEYE